MPASKVKIDDNTVELTIANADADWLIDVTEPDAVILPAAHPQGPPEGRRQGQDPEHDRDLGVRDDHADRHRPVQVHQVRDRPVQPVRGVPGLLQGSGKIKNIFVKRMTGDAAIAQPARPVSSTCRSASTRPRRHASRRSPTLDVLSTPASGRTARYFNLLDQHVRPELPQGGRLRHRRAGHRRQHLRWRRRRQPGRQPGHARGRRPEFYDFDPAKAKEHLAQSSWDKSKPLRIVFDNSFAGVTLWTPVMQQNLEAVGFKVELTRPRDARRPIEEYNKIDDYDITDHAGRRPGRGPLQRRSYYNCKLRPTPPCGRPTTATATIDDAVPAAAQGARCRQARTSIFKEHLRDAEREAVDKTSLWTTNALSFKSKCLQGPSSRRTPASSSSVSRTGPSPASPRNRSPATEVATCAPTGSLRPAERSRWARISFAGS